MSYMHVYRKYIESNEDGANNPFPNGKSIASYEIRMFRKESLLTESESLFDCVHSRNAI